MPAQHTNRSTTLGPFVRKPWPEGVLNERLLKLLLSQDGSTTRLCKALLGSIELVLHRQRPITNPELPEKLAGIMAVLGHPPYTERITSLHTSGSVALDHIVYIANARLPEYVQAGFGEGKLPIGTLIEKLPVRRTLLNSPTLETAMAERLAEVSGPIERRASRLYTISFAAGGDVQASEQTAMVIFETYWGALAQAFAGQPTR